jgi:glucosamine--fructose-6-phosphate aminotransferase (isomerizing)
MCGIVGYVGHRDVRDVLLAGLERLEYRGYDSAGISVLAGDRLESVRAVGNLSALRAAVERRDQEEAAGPVAVAAPPATTGIGHTRWATHGRVTEENAHPHFDGDDRVHVVVNGIVENYLELKHELLAQGVEFTSETDVEVIAHLISRELREHGELVAAVRHAYARLRGHYAFVAVAADQPGILVAARKECPLVIGRSDGEQFVGSGIPAFLEHTREVQYLDNDELAIVRPEGVEIITPQGEPVERAIETVEWDAEAAEKGGYETFMLKEIHEQADAVAETLADRTVRRDGVDLGDLGGIDDTFLRTCRSVTVVACGTSYHAGLIGRYAIEEWARVPVQMDVASEYRYRNPVVGPGDLVVGITQSGRDRRHAGRHAPGAASAARRSWPSRTSWARRPRATPTACSSPARAWRSASPPRRPSSPRWRRCTCSRCGSPSCAEPMPTQRFFARDSWRTSSGFAARDRRAA